jgi:hypothetical protein
MRALLPFVFALAAAGCIAPITPMERLQQSANEVAAALRFNRTDVAAEYCAAAAHDEFLVRHAVWGQKTRIVDLELSGIYLRASDEAESIIAISWLREDGAILHSTEIAQRWKRTNGSFRMVDEVFHGGDKALFDMLPKKQDPKKPADRMMDDDPPKEHASSERALRAE